MIVPFSNFYFQIPVSIFYHPSSVTDSNEDLQELLNKAYFYLKFRPRSKKEVADYLLKKIKKRHWSTDDVDKVIKQLEEQNLINDKEFVSWFVEQRNASKPKSQFVLRGELLRFGIDKDVIDNFFMEHEEPEDGLALKALQSRWRRFSALPKKERFAKSAAFLSRRGFSFDLIRKTISKLEEK